MSKLISKEIHYKLNCAMFVYLREMRGSLHFVTELVLFSVNMLWRCFKALVKVRWKKFSNVIQNNVALEL